MRWEIKMVKSQFDEMVREIGTNMANETVQDTKRISGHIVKRLITQAYEYGCQDTFEMIRQDPSVLRRRIGFIQ